MGYRRHPDVRFTALEDEGVVLHLGTRRYFTVSESGLAILEALAEPRTLAEVVDVLEARYEVSAQQADESARAFLKRCLGASLLVDDKP